MMKYLIYIGLALFTLVSCRGEKGLSKTELPEKAEVRPDWVDNRPISSAYYIGIGSSSKKAHPADFAEDAKSNALNDLASEISVTVTSESFLSTLEVNYNFREEFMSQINTFTEEKVTGFEVIDSWQDEDQYWIYYRLSKAKHAEIKAETKKGILQSAYDSYKRGLQNEEKGLLKMAVNDFLGGLQSMEMYWGEPNPFTAEDGSEIFLDNALYAALNRIIQGITIETPVNEIVLNSENLFEMEVGIKTAYIDSEVAQIPLLYHYDREKYMKRRSIQSNAEGLVGVTVKEVNTKSDNLRLELELDTDMLFGTFKHDPIMAQLIRGLEGNSIQVPIRVIMPKIFISSEESNLGEELGSPLLANTAKNELIERGFSLSNNVTGADFIVQIQGATREAGTAQGFHKCYLDMEIEVIHASSGQVIYQKTETNIKGLQMDYQTAGMEAYKKGVKLIKSTWGKEFTKQLM